MVFIPLHDIANVDREVRHGLGSQERREKAVGDLYYNIRTSCAERKLVEGQDGGLPAKFRL